MAIAFIEGGTQTLQWNRFVVAYNRYLLVKYQSHINVEACNQSKAIKYMFKYVTKGPDRSTVVITNSADRACENSHNDMEGNDEIKNFLDCRYISACEAVWRIYEFPIHYRKLAVEKLCYHLEDELMLFFNDNEPLPRIVNTEKARKTMFTEWMEINKTDSAAKSLTYAEFPTKYVCKKGTLMWKRRKSGRSIGRLTYAHPSSGERYYLRLLLNIVKGCETYEQIREFNGIVYPSMKMACNARGLLEDDGEWHEAINEANHWASGPQLRELFLTILLFCDLSDASKFWEYNWRKISDDILRMRRRILRLLSLVLGEGEHKFDRGLEDKTLLAQLKNRLLMEEQNHDIRRLEEEHQILKDSLNQEQYNVYEKVVNAVEQNKSKLFFLYGYGGAGKTFLYKAIINKLRSESKIVLAVSSSGITALLLPGGRTAHSRFRIPLTLDENSTCTIKQSTQLAELIQKAALTIWDEAPMDSKFAFEAVDKTMKYILRGTPMFDIEKPFGGKIVLLGGDFRQILPVIPRGTRDMRLQKTTEQVDENIMSLNNFSDWTLQIGNGQEIAIIRGDVDQAEWIKIPDEFLLPSSGDLIETMFQSTYPDFAAKKFVPDYLTNRAILTPINEIVNEINAFCMNLVEGDMKEYLSYDMVDKSNENTHNSDMLYPVEFLNSVNFPEIHNHCLELKVGVPIMLLRNINPSQGMCNGTRLIVSQLGKRVIEGTIISGSHVGHRSQELR